ncbi:hypothetical protein [Pseudoalteromonas tetraodonis]|uniref:hypothetical protein n=1 Tax=Pseudoalteromonas tetraodonis TaxID=43659 RepID=UPI003CFFE7D0
MSDWTDMLPSAVKTPITIYKNKKFLHKWWKRLQVSAGMGQTNILITGAAGAGKTVLATCYHGEVKDMEWEEPETSNDIENLPITIGEWTQIVTVLPGQDIKARSIGLTKTLHRGTSIEGIIHVVDFGYTSIRSEFSQKASVESGIETIDDLRKVNLERELTEFKKICEHIKTANNNGNGPKWLVIAVNKADLYLDELDDAKKYYHQDGQGPFVEELKSLIGNIGKQNIVCKTIPVCPKPKPYTWNGVEITPQLTTFKEPSEYMRNFSSIIAKTSGEVTNA